MILGGAVCEANLYISCRGKTVTALTSFPFPVVYINLRIGFADLFCKANEKLSPFFGLVWHIDPGKKLCTLVVIRATPATDAIISQSICGVEIHIFG